mmetsp:Transcript_24168/g.40011  ORF Transcript_24168/g.40011 Transcript_24168/m.40011 type:complete len:960 (-) Transcript_24168:67-2946(-)
MSEEQQQQQQQQPRSGNANNRNRHQGRGGRGRGRGKGRSNNNNNANNNANTGNKQQQQPVAAAAAAAAVDGSNSNNSSNNSSNSSARPKRKARSKMGGFESYANIKDLMQRYYADADTDTDTTSNNTTSNNSNKTLTLIRGKIRMLPGKDSTAFVTCDRGSLERDVVIMTPKDQNRALDGDIVFVELAAVVETKTKTATATNKETNKEKEEEDDDNQLAEDLNELSMNAVAATETKQQETWQDDTVQMSLWDPVVPVRKVSASAAPKVQEDNVKGRVVYVVPPKETAGTQPSELNSTSASASSNNNAPIAPRRTIVGTMNAIRPKDKKPIYLLTPNNKSMPQFLCPGHFRPSEGEGGLYKAEYVYGTWDETHNWPPCINVKEMGRSCNVQDETLALLVENGVDHGDFPSAALKDVQDAVASGLIMGEDDQDLGWRPTPQMYQGRRDYRQQRIFTIDPTTAKDLDDALHITQLPDGRVEIGVHIADVSFFLTPQSAVDVEATRRATTVYLVDRVIPMLPRPLCEVACSLNENVERLAFSCVWKMNMDGTLANNNKKGGGVPEDVWYGRSVIKSCARLDYATAQNIIDAKVGNGESAGEMDERLWPKSRQPTGGHTVDDVAFDVRLMHKVAMARRRLRFLNGALALNGVKLSFKLESDGETPGLCAPYPMRDSNRLVEEYMLMANYLVAQRLITHSGALAVLRHHPPPLTIGLESVVQIAKEARGFVIDPTSSQSLQASLSRMGRECDDELVMQCVTQLLMTPMKPADYMAAGSVSQEEWRHFALNIPYYTHFTSPIRRYADVMVHRLLQATIDDTVDDFPMKQNEIQTVCEHCNEKKMASKSASDRSDVVFLAIYLKNKPLRSTLGVVISVGEKTFTVYIPELGCSGKLFLDEHKQMVDSAPFEARNGTRHIKLTSKRTSTFWKQIDIKVFCKLKVDVVCKERPPIDIKVLLNGPWVEDA